MTKKKIVRPYGDTTGDGMVQVSFTLPLPHDKRAEGAALQLARKMGMEPALLVHAKAMGPDFTFFVVYGSVSHLVDLREVTVVEREYPLLTAKEVNLSIKRSLRRKLVVVGACIGTDAHTVGIDAILNIKGFAGEKGLEYYREIRVVNLGAQVLVLELVAQARAERADAVLVSQVVTQKDAHIHNTSAMSAAFREAYPSGQVPLLVVVGGCIGTDAHTVGIDAILNIKGFAGEKGLEYYRELKVVNLGAQVSVPQLVERAREEKADAVLVSQVVTQRDAHLLNTREMSAAFRESYPEDKRPLLVVGGPRFDETMASELGVDRVFTRGTTPGEVASFIVHRLVNRKAS